MTTNTLFEFDNSFRRELSELGVEWRAATVPEPAGLVFNDDLARELGVDPAAVRSGAGIEVLAGNVEPPGSEPIAMAYAGHQFGGYSPQLGDGRALLLGEVVGKDGRRRDLHLKGSGRTPFARGGDGKAVVGPMLREYLFAEAMHTLAVPTARALAVVATGEQIQRDVPEPGAVLTRVAASHVRVGTFEYAARTDDPALIQRLADYSIARHYPEAADAPDPYLAFLDAVIEAQASLVARWMLVGFVHGVMNTDNTTISGETIDYGPYAFIDRYDPATVFSSIDHGGRYAFGSQPRVVQWNLARLAETLLPLIGTDIDAATEAATASLVTLPDRYHRHWAEGMGRKLGISEVAEQDAALFDDLLDLFQAQGADYTSGFRGLAHWLRGDHAPLGALFDDTAAIDEWTTRWGTRLGADRVDVGAVATAMDRVNPIYIPRNHLVDEALAAATEGELAPFEALLDRVTHPFDERAGAEAFAEPAPDGFTESFQTFCGT